MNTQNELVLEIQNEFNTSSNKILDEFSKIVHPQTETIETLEKLQKTGFCNCENYLDLKRLENKNKNLYDLNEYIGYLKLKYPTYKFISYEQVQEICVKYGLVLGHSRYFKGNIPENNIKDILNFKVNDEDIKYRRNENYKNYYFNYNNLCLYSDFSSGFSYYKKDDYIPCEFFICAPIDQMIIDNENIVDNEIKFENEDPIVLCPVKFGFLIVTAWGPEAKDEKIFNEQHN